MRKDFISQAEELNNLDELLEQRRKVLKRWNIVNIFIFCVFLTVILARCSLGLSQNTISPSDEVVPSDKTATIARIDIGVNKDFAVENDEYFKAATENRIPDDMDEVSEIANVSAIEYTYRPINKYYIKSTSLTTEDLGDKGYRALDSNDGVGAAEFQDFKTLFLLHHEALVGDSVKPVGYYYKYDSNLEYSDTTETGEAYRYPGYDKMKGFTCVIYVDREITDAELQDMASTLVESLDSKKVEPTTLPDTYPYWSCIEDYIHKIKGTVYGMAYATPSTHIEGVHSGWTAIVINIDQFFFDYSTMFQIGGTVEYILEQGYHH